MKAKYIRYAALLAALTLLLSGCGSSAPEPTAEPTAAPTATAVPTPEPTAEPAPEPTAEPTPEPLTAPEEDSNYYNGKSYVDVSRENVAALAAKTGLTLAGTDTIDEEGYLNILLLGTDERLPNTLDIGRADCTMLCSVNTRTGELKLVSFERGVRVPVPGKNLDQINHAYAVGGPILSENILRECFSLKIDGYAQADYDIFIAVVDALGGVDIDLTEIEALALNGKYRTNATTGTPMTPGVNHLNGYDALQYCRLRYPDSDWERQQRQRNTIRACLEKMKTLDQDELTALWELMLDEVNSNLTPSQIAALLKAAPLILSENNITELQVPDRNSKGGAIACDFTYESMKIDNFLYGTDYDITSPY